MTRSTHATPDPAGTLPPRGFARRHAPLAWAGAAALVLLLAATLLLPRRAAEPPPPAPARWFNDDAGLVSPGFAAGKNQYLMTQRRAQVLVVTGRGGPQGPLEAWTTRAVNAWRTGALRRDNGLVLFVLPDTRAVRLEVGYGLEAALPDVDAARLLDATLLPAFERGRYEEGFDAFLSALFERLDALPADAPLVGLDTGMLHFALSVLRQAPRYGADALALFRGADAGGRVALSLFGTVFVVVFGYLARAVAEGLIALVQLPWRLVHGTAARTLDWPTLRAEFAPGALVKRPPPSIVAVVRELGVAQIGYGAFCAAGIVVAIAFLAVGSDVFVPARGQFSGAGVTKHWSSR